jgi:hypothetical protein
VLCQTDNINQMITKYPTVVESAYCDHLACYHLTGVTSLIDQVLNNCLLSTVYKL